VALREAVRLKPEYAEAHNELGYVYQETGHFAEAVDEFKIAIRQKSDYSLAHYNLAIAYLDMGNRNGALEQYKILQRMDPTRAAKLAPKVNK
jgi:Flp pilus assembly protein TadD